MPSAELFAYPRETVVAEKCQAMVKLGMVNSRVKDFYDLWYLAAHFDFDGLLLARAVEATFKQRQTAIPSQLPTGLTPAYYDDPARQAQWRAFVRKSSLPGSIPAFDEVVVDLTAFLMPLLTALHTQTVFARQWEHRTGMWQIGEPLSEPSPDSPTRAND